MGDLDRAVTRIEQLALLVSSIWLFALGHFFAGAVCLVLVVLSTKVSK